MAAAREEVQPAVRQPAGQADGVFRRDEVVGAARDDERRRLDPVEPRQARPGCERPELIREAERVAARAQRAKRPRDCGRRPRVAAPAAPRRDERETPDSLRLGARELLRDRVSEGAE